jgi:NAD(P)H-hydrate epimerase
MPENADYVSNWQVADIGLSKTFIDQQEPSYYYTQRHDVVHLMAKRNKFDHKTHFGRTMLLAGSMGKMGAAVLSARACLRAGAGLLTLHIPRCGYDIMQIAVPEAMVSVDLNERFISGCPDLEQFDTIAVGPGLDQHYDTFDVLSRVLQQAKGPVVLDADALNIIAREKEFLRKLPEGSILTPHPGEFKRIVGFWANDFERLEQQMAYSKEYKVFIVLKGAHTSISTPDGKVFFNSTGNPGMATGGSGDVLTGIITGFLAQRLAPQNACLLAVYLHGLAGDYAAQALTEQAMNASDIIDHLPKALQSLQQHL